MDSIPFSLPIASIGLYYASTHEPILGVLIRLKLVGYYPQMHAVVVSAKGDLNNHDNRNPNGHLYHENLKKRLSVREYATWERAKSAHRNCLENMPLFVATVFAGILAEQKAGAGAVGLNLFCLAVIVLRACYVANYITTETKGWSMVRSLLYAIALGWSFKTLWSSAVIVGN